MKPRTFLDFRHILYYGITVTKYMSWTNAKGDVMSCVNGRFKKN